MKTVLNIKTDIEVKKQAQKIARDIGLPLSTVVNAYLKEFIQNRRVTFSTEPQVRPEVEKRLLQASRDYKEGENIVGPFRSAKEMDAYLDN